MIDFAITPNGDLILEEQHQPEGLKISFRIAERKGLNIKFHIAEQKPFKPKDESAFKLSFMVEQKTKTAHKAKLVKDIEMKIQRIRIALMTERGELPERENVGSRLHLIRHENLYDRENLKIIEELVAEAIADILPEARIIAKPERGRGVFYAQNINIYIYNQGTLIFKFYI